jgi:hypothetical protein
VEDAGFSVSALVAYFNFDGLAISKDKHWSYENNVYHFVTADNKTLNGIQKIRFIDKNFITKSEYKKHSSTIKSHCYTTGETCDKCDHSSTSKARVYHIQLVEA